MEKEFGYISRFHVKDCYASQDFWVPVAASGERFSHLILTGRNGSGKSTILRGLDSFGGSIHSAGQPKFLRWKGGNNFVDEVEIFGTDANWERGANLKVYFPANRNLQVKEVKAPTPDEAVRSVLSKSGLELAPSMVQFLVNRRVSQAFAQIAGKSIEVEQAEHFFESLENRFRTLFGDDSLKMIFLEKSYDFVFQFEGGRRVSFSQLPDGLAASTFLLMDLVMRVDAIRSAASDYSIDPPGIVLLDEPELHMHLGLQYEILPLLTTLFPKIQFIVATHSPAVASSIKNATVFDLTTKQVAPSYTAGAAYSELMQTHFGLENEFGPVADQILDQAKAILKKKDKAIVVSEMKKLLEENADVLTPTLRLELESTMIRFQAEENLKK